MATIITVNSKIVVNESTEFIINEMKDNGRFGNYYLILTRVYWDGAETVYVNPKYIISIQDGAHDK